MTKLPQPDLTLAIAMCIGKVLWTVRRLAMVRHLFAVLVCLISLIWQ